MDSNTRNRFDKKSYKRRKNLPNESEKSNEELDVSVVKSLHTYDSEGEMYVNDPREKKKEDNDQKK